MDEKREPDAHTQAVQERRYSGAYGAHVNKGERRTRTRKAKLDKAVREETEG